MTFVPKEISQLNQSTSYSNLGPDLKPFVMLLSLLVLPNFIANIFITSN